MKFNISTYFSNNLEFITGVFVYYTVLFAIGIRIIYLLFPSE